VKLHQILSSFEAYLRTGSPLAFAAAFLGGVLVSLTPCVYPILPVTVGFLGSRGGGSRRRTFLLSGAYAIGMALTYAALGMAAGLTGKVFGEVTAHPLSYLAMANVCLVLALSMFDVIRVPLPAFLSRTGSAGGSADGIAGALVVGLFSGVIVGPCTAPVLGGLLLYVGASGNPLFGASLLFTFAMGMGLPVVALGAFAGLLAALPKSGAWTTRIQRAFGVLLLLAAEYLLLEAGRRLV
jgi:cytochrome c-type biogenesis protein